MSSIKTAAAIERNQPDFQTDNHGGYWLNEGVNYFGSHSSNTIIFQGEQVAPFAGIFFLRKDTVLIRVAKPTRIMYGRKTADNQIIFSNGHSAVLQYGDLKFRIVCEEGRYAVSFMIVTK